MKVLIIGSGGREHALAWACKKSKFTPRITCLPGNGGTQLISQNIDIAVNQFDRILDYIHEQKFDLTIIGPDDPIAAGLADLISSRGYRVFAPSALAAQIEASKAFAKDLMSKHNIPTAEFSTFSDYSAAKAYILTQDLPIVVKASGLALGKGAFVCLSTEEALITAKQILEDKLFGDAGKEIIIEKFLQGRELSLTVVADGEDFILLPPSRDHKRAYDGGEGPNTGGMGVVSPLDDISDDLINRVVNNVVRPLLSALNQMGRPFRGCLYPGLMVGESGDFHVLEVNARFGDPETQAILPLLKIDFLELLLEVADGNLKGWLKSNSLIGTDWKAISLKHYAVTVVIASSGYPGSYKKGIEITSLPKDSDTTAVFHAGTRRDNNRLLTNGGRVLAITGLGSDSNSAAGQAYKAVEQVKFDGLHFRRDIGRGVS